MDVLDLVADLPLWPLVTAYLLFAILCAEILRGAATRWLAHEEGKMAPQVHQVLSRSLPRALAGATFLFLLALAVRVFPLPPKFQALTKHALPFLFGTLGVAFLMRIALSAIAAYGETYPQLKSTAGIGRAITWVVGCVLLAVLVSDAAGISLAPALTALGLGSLAVALALQDTLSNFFSGVYLILDKPIRPGDFIRLDTQEGYVEAIGWRSTHLRTLLPSTIIVPDATLSKAIITNFGPTNPRLLLATPIDVALDADADKVQVALEDEAKTAIDIGGVEKTPAPFVRFALGDRGFTFTLYVTIAPTADGGLVQQQVRRRAIARIRREGATLAPPNPFAKHV